MAFADDLLEQAQHLATRDTGVPSQANLRRAVSSAYYALFHFLIYESALNWNRADQRHTLGRVFEHRKMKAACRAKVVELEKSLKSNVPASAESETAKHLYLVCKTFVQVQEKRHIADYDNATGWTRADALAQIDRVTDAFTSWNTIRDEEVSQEFLISLLTGKDRS